MQQRRFRPGDVVDDYCPRERRLTDHAIVAMIDERIQLTRCCVCDAEHEYKDGKVPAQRRRKAQPALFSQVLEGLQGPHPARPANPEAHFDARPESLDEPAMAVPGIDEDRESARPLALSPSPNGHATLDPERVPVVDVAAPDHDRADTPVRDEGPVRRSLIRATLPRPEGQPPAARAIPEFTIRQPNNNRGQRGSGRRRGRHGAPGGQGHIGPMRFGRDGNSYGQSNGNGQRSGGRHHDAGGRSRHRRGKKR
jgi:hypothetical protein